MDRPAVKKAVNQLKATIERRQGPADKSQDAVPIADAMQAFWDRGMLTFTIPAHNGGRGPAPDFTRWAGLEAARFDLPMSHGVDTRGREVVEREDPDLDQGYLAVPSRTAAIASSVGVGLRPASVSMSPEGVPDQPAR